MAAPVPPVLSDTACYEFRVRRRHEEYDQEFNTVTHWRIQDAGAITTDVASLFNALIGAWRTNMLPITANTVVAGQYELRTITGQESFNDADGNIVWRPVVSDVRYQTMEVLVGSPPPDQGTFDLDAATDTEMLPPYCSIGFHRRTTLALRGAQSTVRFGPIPELWQVDGLVTASARAAFLTASTFFNPTGIGFGGDDSVAIPVIFRKKTFLEEESNIIKPVGVFAPAVSSVHVATYLGTQNTRKNPTSRIGY